MADVSPVLVKLLLTMTSSSLRCWGTNSLRKQKVGSIVTVVWNIIEPFQYWMLGQYSMAHTQEWAWHKPLTNSMKRCLACWRCFPDETENTRCFTCHIADASIVRVGREVYYAEVSKFINFLHSTANDNKQILNIRHIDVQTLTFWIGNLFQLTKYG